MRITPRKDEVKALVELLESDSYDSADALAKDLLKRTYELFLERDWYAHAFRTSPGSLVLAWGPFTSDNEVEKFAKTFAIDGEHISVKLYSPARQSRIDAEHIKAAMPITCECGHPQGLHEHDGAAGRCVARGCRCKKLREEPQSDG